MKISQAIKNFLAYQKLNSKKTSFKTTGTSLQYELFRKYIYNPKVIYIPERVKTKKKHLFLTAR